METSVFENKGQSPLRSSSNGVISKSAVSWNIPLQGLPHVLANEVGFTDVSDLNSFSSQSAHGHKRRKAMYLGLSALTIMLFTGLFWGEKKEPPLQQTPMREHISPSAMWQPLAKPPLTFAFSAPEWEKFPQTYQVWQHEGLGLMEDRLALGRFSEIGMHAQLAVFRSTSSSRTSDATSFFARTFYLDLVRASAQNGLGMMRLGRVDPIKTKFGLLETADVVLSDGTSERICLGYRHISIDSQLRFNGWLCGDPQHTASREDLACFVDTISVKPNGGDPALRQAFATMKSKQNPSCDHTKTTSSTFKTGVTKRL
jgi:hypothetical protein